MILTVPGLNAPSAMNALRFPRFGARPIASENAAASPGSTATANLRRMLRRRGLTINTLAWCIHSSRSHVSQVLANKPGRGGQTRRKLAAMLLDAELALLGWDRQGKVLHGT